jgi:hypothetical protein
VVRSHGAAPAGVCGVRQLKLLGFGGRAGPRRPLKQPRDALGGQPGRRVGRDQQGRAGPPARPLDAGSSWASSIHASGRERPAWSSIASSFQRRRAPGSLRRGAGTEAGRPAPARAVPSLGRPHAGRGVGWPTKRRPERGNGAQLRRRSGRDVALCQRGSPDDSIKAQRKCRAASGAGLSSDAVGVLQFRQLCASPGR